MFKYIAISIFSFTIFSIQAQETTKVSESLANEANTPFSKNINSKKEQELMVPIMELLESSNAPIGEEIQKRLVKALTTEFIELKQPQSTEKITNFYNYGAERTYLISRIYNCGKCDKWHLNNATAWALSQDGLMVSNYHIISKILEPGAVVIDARENIYPVMDVLVANKAEDFVIFKVQIPESKKIKAFNLGKPAQVGDNLHLVSHPQGIFFHYSRGYVAGYKSLRSPTVKDNNLYHWMSTELGYLQGSSGGGVFNDKGEIVGMVSFIKNKKNDFANKIFESCVPISNIQKRIKLID